MCLLGIVCQLFVLPFSPKLFVVVFANWFVLPFSSKFFVLVFATWFMLPLSPNFLCRHVWGVGFRCRFRQNLFIVLLVKTFQTISRLDCFFLTRCPQHSFFTKRTRQQPGNSNNNDNLTIWQPGNSDNLATATTWQQQQPGNNKWMV